LSQHGDRPIFGRSENSGLYRRNSGKRVKEREREREREGIGIEVVIEIMKKEERSAA